MTAKTLTKKERLVRQARGKDVDRVPSLGGWIGGARVVAQIASITTDEYLADPMGGVVKAAVALDVDGMIQPAAHTELEQVRTGLVEEARFAGIEPEALLERANSLPDSEREVLATFDGAAEEQRYRDELGVDPYELRKLRSGRGEEPLFFAGLSVSRTRPFGTPQDIRDEVDYFLDFSDGGKGLFLITSNVTGVELPPANICEAYRYVKSWDPAATRQPGWRRWPWQETHR